MREIYVKKVNNNIYFLCNPDETFSKTTWRFRNYNLIMPNKLGYDIDNYIDTDIKVDFRKRYTNIIVGKFIDFNNFYIATDLNSIWPRCTQVSLTDNFSELYENVELTGDNVIVHLFDIKDTNHKIRKIIIPINILDGIGELIIEFSNFGEYLELIYGNDKIDLDINNNFNDIDIMDYDKMSELLVGNNSRMAYDRLLIMKI